MVTKTHLRKVLFCILCTTFNFTVESEKNKNIFPELQAKFFLNTENPMLLCVGLFGISIITIELLNRFIPILSYTSLIISFFTGCILYAQYDKLKNKLENLLPVNLFTHIYSYLKPELFILYPIIFGVVSITDLLSRSIITINLLLLLLVYFDEEQIKKSSNIVSKHLNNYFILLMYGIK